MKEKREISKQEYDLRVNQIYENIKEKKPKQKELIDKITLLELKQKSKVSELSDLISKKNNLVLEVISNKGKIRVYKRKISANFKMQTNITNLFVKQTTSYIDLNKIIKKLLISKNDLGMEIPESEIELNVELYEQLSLILKSLADDLITDQLHEKEILEDNNQILTKLISEIKKVRTKIKHYTKKITDSKKELKSTNNYLKENLQEDKKIKRLYLQSN